MKRLLTWTLLMLAALYTEASAQRSEAYGGQLGTVHPPATCNEAAQPYVERGLALLHHMTYEGAADAFAAAIDADPQCALGYWGQAMSYIHPLWSDPPAEATFEKGRALVDIAQGLEQMTDPERAYLAAVAAYYAEGWNLKETANLAAFATAWETVHQQYPDDLEAAAFYALAFMATADRSDKTFAKQKRAGAIAEKVLKTSPDHPGAHHYVIHAYDVPPLAEQALEVARHYGTIAPAVPHALHMPTHIFTRLGLWDESIAWNRRSAAAALNHPVGEATSLHYLHALDYLAYAYLQRAEDQKAEQVQATLLALEGPFQIEIATPYTFAAVPARIVLERQQWDAAAALEPRAPGSYPWDRFPAMEAITHFARALGAARSGNEQTARQALDRLSTLHEQAARTSAYWARQIEIQRMAAAAWLAYEQGEQDKALATMQQAAALEAATEKHPVTPGEVLPARELLGDMLFDLGRYEEAQAAYEAALARSPNRLNSLFGAGRAAEGSGDLERAAAFYRQLAETTAHADVELAQRQHAQAFLEAMEP